MNWALKQLPDKALALLKRYKWVLFVFGLGLCLLALPTGSTEEIAPEVTLTEHFSLAETEAKFAKIFSEIEGAGTVSVALSLASSPRQVLALDVKNEADSTEESTVLIAQGSGTEAAVPLQELYPEFKGAVIVSDGAEHPKVRLALLEAARALTGLGADKISICSRGK